MQRRRQPQRQSGQSPTCCWRAAIATMAIATAPTSLLHAVNLSRRACKPPMGRPSGPPRRLLGHLPLLLLLLLPLQPAGAAASTSPSARLHNQVQPVDKQQANMHPAPASSDVVAGEVHRFQVATVEFERVETPFLIGLWIFCASLAKIGFHMAPKLSKIFPESCLLIVVGVVIGGLLLLTTNSATHMSPLTPDTFFLYMLPPIILDAGYFMPNRLFFDHLGTILLFAVVGTIFNTLTIGASLWAVGQTGLFGVTTPLLDIFLFAALISAVDPVAVLAVFEEIHVDEILYIVVFGESLLNDAVTVVLYHMFEAYKGMGPQNIIVTDYLSGLASFFVVAIGGTVIGVLWGFATGFVTRFTHEVRVIEPIFIFVMAYLAYLNAEIFHMSGILAITFCGITMKNYVEANISHKSHTTVKYAMKMLSSSSETIIFMFLGVATVHKAHDWNSLFVLLTIVFCSVYRVVGVIILTAIANRFRLHQLEKVEKFVMSYGGLRGAVAFALVLLIDPKLVPLQPMFMTTTIAVVYFTVFFQGITIKPLVKILNVKRAEKRKPTMNERIHERLMDHLMAGIEDVLGHHGNYHVRDRFKRFDNKFIRPYLLRNHQGAEPKILETYSKLTMRDAMDYMRRNASTIGNISGTESMSAIFRNYSNFNGSPSFSQLDSSTWNIDMQELEYNPSRKDLTDAKIHHLLAEELCKPYRRHRRLSYSRHAVNDRDLSTQVNYKMHMNIRRMGKHHSKRGKKMGKDGKQNHVSFPELQQNGTAKQFTHDYLDEVINQEEDQEYKPKRDEEDSPIMFTVKSSPSDGASTDCSASLTSQCDPGSLGRSKPTAAEAMLPWRRDRSSYIADDSTYTSSDKRMSKESDGGDSTRVTTPTATETMLPWKRDDENENAGVLQQNEFPAWASNKEYLAYNSPSATFLGGIETARSSVIGLFRRESSGSGHQLSASSGGEGSPSAERRGSVSGGHASVSGGHASSSTACPSTVLLIESAPTDPLGVHRGSVSAQGQRRHHHQHHQPRRGSMLEITGLHHRDGRTDDRPLSRDIIPEELASRTLPHHPTARRPSYLRCQSTPKATPKRQHSLEVQLFGSSSESSLDEDINALVKAGFTNVAR